MKYLIYAVFFSLVLAGCVTEDAVKLDGKSFSVEIADEGHEMSKGLMNREFLCENCGMLFVFQKESKHIFWMKNTLIPLDIVHINSNFTVVDIIRAEPCKTLQCPTYGPDKKSLYVLEVNQGTISEEAIGTKAHLTLVR